MMLSGLAMLLVSAVSTQCVSGGAPHQNVVVVLTEENSAPLLDDFFATNSTDPDKLFAFPADYEQVFVENILELETSIGLLSQDLAESIEENWKESQLEPIVEPPGSGGEIIEPIEPEPVPDIPPWVIGGNLGTGPAHAPKKSIDHIIVDSLADTYVNLVQLSNPSFELLNPSAELNLLDVQEIAEPLISPDLSYFDDMVSGPDLADWIDAMFPPAPTQSSEMTVELNEEMNILGDWFFGIDISPNTTAIAYNSFVNGAVTMAQGSDPHPDLLLDFVNFVNTAITHFKNFYDLTNSSGFSYFMTYLMCLSTVFSGAGVLYSVLSALISSFPMVAVVMAVLAVIGMSAFLFYIALVILGGLGLGFRAGLHMRWIVVPVGLEVGFYRNDQ